MEENKPKLVSINSKVEKAAYEHEEAKQEAIAELFSKAIELTYEGHVNHAVVILQGDNDQHPYMLVAGDSSDVHLYKMYHYLSTTAPSEYDFGISCIHNELEDDEE